LACIGRGLAVLKSPAQIWCTNRCTEGAQEPERRKQTPCAELWLESRNVCDDPFEIIAVIDELPQLHSAVWDIFKEVSNTRHTEAYEQLLADDSVRMEFYERFSQFARKFAVALSSASFLDETPEARVDKYKADLQFSNTLRTSVWRRYAETVDFSEYEPKIKKLLDSYIATDSVQRITGAVDLFNKEARIEAIKEAHGDSAKADVIAPVIPSGDTYIPP